MREKGSRSCDQSATRDQCLSAWRLPHLSPSLPISPRISPYLPISRPVPLRPARRLPDAPPPPPRCSHPDEAYAPLERGEQLPRVLRPAEASGALLRLPSDPKSMFRTVADWVVMPSASDCAPCLVFGADVAQSRGAAFVWGSRGTWDCVAGMRLPRLVPHLQSTESSVGSAPWVV